MYMAPKNRDGPVSRSPKPKNYDRLRYKYILQVHIDTDSFRRSLCFSFFRAIQTSIFHRLSAVCFFQLAAQNVIGFYLESPHVRSKNTSEGENLVENSICPRRNEIGLVTSFVRNRPTHTS